MGKEVFPLSIIDRARTEWVNLLADEKLFFLLSFAILLPFYICGPLILGSTCYLIFKKRLFVFNRISEAKWFYIFVSVAITTAIVYRSISGCLVGLALLFFLILFQYYHLVVTPRLFTMNLKVFVWGSIPLAIYSYLVYIFYVFSNGYDLLYVFKYQNIQSRAKATFLNANLYGLFIAMVIVMAIYLLYRDRSRLNRWLCSLAILLNLLSLILSASRWAIPTMIVGSVIMVFFLIPKLAWGLAGVLGTGLMVLIIKPSILPRFSTLAHGFEDRFELWDTGWKIFLTQPLVGRGPLAFVNNYYLFLDRGKMHSHNLLIDTLANYGLVGLMNLVMATGHYFRNLINKSWQVKSRPEMGLIIALIATVCFQGIMDVGIFWVQMGYMMLTVVSTPLTLLESLNESNI